MLTTRRLLLRPCRDADKPVFRAILNTPGMMAELGGVQEPAAIDALVDKRIRDQQAHGHSYWGVELRETGELIGSCGVRIADNYPGTPVDGLHEVGWRIAEHHWGKGYAQEAARASLDWTWENTGAQIIASFTTPDNRRSWRLMERLGMSRRPDLDFLNPRYAPDHPLAPTIVYAAKRPEELADASGCLQRGR